MQENGVVSGETAVNMVNELLAKEKNHRLTIIKSLSLTRVNAYIATVNEMIGSGFNLIPVYKGFDSYRYVYKSRLIPLPLLPQLKDLSIELNQQKAILKNLDRVRNHTSRNKTKRSLELLSTTLSQDEVKPEAQSDSAIKSINPPEEEMAAAIKDEEQEFILDTLESHHKLLQTCEELRSNAAKAEVELKESKQVLEQTRAHNKTLQEEMNAARCQLLELQKSREESQAVLTALTMAHQQLQSMQITTQEHVKRLELGMSLMSTLHNQPIESKKSPVEIVSNIISKKDLTRIFRANYCNTRSSFFACSTSLDNSLICLQSLLKTRKTSFSYAEIKECIKDEAILNVFMNPLDCHPEHLSNTTSIFRDIALHFAASSISLKTEQQQPAF